MVERQTVNLYVVGSIPTGAVYNGVSPSGKAQDFDSCITLVQIQLPQFCYKANGLAPMKYIKYILSDMPGSAFLEHPEYLDDYLPWNPLVKEFCR